MYETWVLDGRTQVVIMGGRVVTERDARRWGDRRWCWVEVSSFLVCLFFFKPIHFVMAVFLLRGCD